jgi:hypothetical protein
MLKNDPPPGTKVRFLREVRKAKFGAVGTLVRPVRKYLEDRPEDEFVVKLGEDEITAQRRDIE